MDLNKFKGEPITIVRTIYSETERDNLGQYIITEERRTVKGILGVSSTRDAGKPFNQIQESTMVAIFDYGVDVKVGDYLEARGTVFEIDGIPTTFHANLAPGFKIKPPTRVTLKAIGAVSNE